MSHIYNVLKRGPRCQLRTLFTSPDYGYFFVASGDGQYHAFVDASSCIVIPRRCTGTRGSQPKLVQVEFACAEPNGALVISQLLRNGCAYGDLPGRGLRLCLGNAFYDFANYIKEQNLIYNGTKSSLMFRNCEYEITSMFLSQLFAFRRYEETHDFIFDQSSVKPLTMAVQRWRLDHRQGRA